MTDLRPECCRTREEHQACFEGSVCVGDGFLSAQHHFEGVVTTSFGPDHVMFSGASRIDRDEI